MPRQMSPEETAYQVRAVSDLSRERLVEQWIKAYGRTPPRGISRRLLERSVAYHLQLAAVGGMPVDLRRKLARLTGGGSAQKVKKGGTARRTSAPRLSPGTRLVREWNGRSHSVEVTESGFLWNGKRWRSLSAVARAITGARWSGPRFFGL